MMTAVASAGGEPSAVQQDFINRVRTGYVRDEQTEGTWV